MNELFEKEELIKESIAECIAKNIDNDARICDVGFDNVCLIKSLLNRKLNFTYNGTDIFDETVEPAQKFVKDNNLSNCVIEKIPFGKFDKKGFNVCVCSRLFHHFNKEDTMFCLNKMIKIMSGEGILFLSDSIRDFNGRNNRFSYTPYFYVNEIAKLSGKEKIEIEYSDNAELDVGEIWILKVTIKKGVCSFKLLKP